MLRKSGQETAYCVEAYNRAYDGLEVPGVLIRRGAEVGLAPWNREEIRADLG